MKKILIIIVVAFGCSNKPINYDLILEGLSKNYVLLSKEIEKDLYLDHFELTEESHNKEMEYYEKSVGDFYKADKDILDYLMSYENDTLQYCNWIKTGDPYSSHLDEMDFITKSKGALILIDNYLSHSQNSIEIPIYVNDLSYEKLRIFYNKNKHLDKSNLRKLYVKNR